MRDPEMCFWLGLAGGPHLSAFYYRNDYAGIEQWSHFCSKMKGPRSGKTGEWLVYCCVCPVAGIANVL
jgi:hypothetical protein